MILTNEALLRLAQDPRLQWASCLGPLRRAYAVRSKAGCATCKDAIVMVSQIPQDAYDAVRSAMKVSAESAKIARIVGTDDFFLPLPSGAIGRL